MPGKGIKCPKIHFNSLQNQLMLRKTFFFHRCFNRTRSSVQPFFSPPNVPPGVRSGADRESPFCNCLGSPKATTGESPAKAIPTFLLTGPMCICFFGGKHIYDKFYGAIVVLKNIHHLQYPPEIFTASLLSWSKPPCKAPQCEM